MSEDTEIEDLRIELAATKYWLRVAFLQLAASGGIQSDDVHQLLSDLKNQDGAEGLTPSQYDAAAHQRLPAILSVGTEIEEFLKAKGR